jgi:SEL1 protein
MLYYEDQIYDDYDDGMPGGDSGIVGDIDDGILESLVIVGLAASLVFLIMYRQQRQQAARRAEEEARRRQQQGDGAPLQQPADRRDFGVRPGEPDFGQWAGGFGH